MIVAGFDCATSTGWALYDLDRPKAAIMAGNFRSQGDGAEELAADAGANVLDVLQRHGIPHFALVEQPMRQVPGGGQGNANTLVRLTAIAAGVCTVLRLRDVPFVTVPVSSWRKSAFGAERKAELAGQAKAARDTSGVWKAAAIEVCQREGIQLPATRKPDRGDQAEAAMLAMLAPRSQVFRAMQGEAERMAA